jgi:hypothetical protein
MLFYHGVNVCGKGHRFVSLFPYYLDSLISVIQTGNMKGIYFSSVVGHPHRPLRQNF